MNVEWNKVTSFSKAVAIVLFIVLPFVGFYYGVQYGKTIAPSTPYQAPATGTLEQASSSPATPPSPISAYYGNPAEWQSDMNTTGGFSISYPIDFDAQDVNSAKPSTSWKANTTSTGNLFFTLTIPKAFEPQTNFADATLTVGSSRALNVLSHCTTTSTVTINGIPFTMGTSAGAAAGNYYETTGYYTLHAGQCFAVEYTIHSTQLANYPVSYQLKPFDKNAVTSLLQSVVRTFKFQ